MPTTVPSRPTGQDPRAALTYVELLGREPDTLRRSETLGLLVIWLGLGTALGVASYLSAGGWVQVLAPGMRGPLAAATAAAHSSRLSWSWLT